MYGPTGVAAFAFPVVRSLQAGQYYFDADKLTAGQLLKMKTPRGSRLSSADIARAQGRLPASLDAEFGRRFDAHKQRMSVLLGKWLAARLSLHVRDTGMDTAGATVTVSRVKTQYFTREKSVRVTGVVGYSAVQSELPAQGFLVTLRGAGREDRCFVPGDGGAVQVLPAGIAAEDWISRERALVFQEAGRLADEDARQRHRFSRIVVQEMAAGTRDAILEWLPKAFDAEIEQGREAARGQTTKEGVVDSLLNLIPFRAMIVALRKGDIPTAIVMGGLDVLSLIPLLGQGARLTGVAAKSAMPWLGMGVRLGGMAGRQGAHHVRLLAGRIPRCRAVSRKAWSGRPRGPGGGSGPWMYNGWRRRCVPARPGSPRCSIGFWVRAGDTAIPDGAWRVVGSGASKAGNGGEIGAMPATLARNGQGGELALLPYGNRAGAYTQVHPSTGRRQGALLAADSEGLLYPVMPVASLERYQVVSSDLVQALEGRRAGRMERSC